MDENIPFDRRLRRLRRDRAAKDFAHAAYLHRRAAEELLDRLALVTRPFETALALGCADDHLSGQLRARGIRTVCADPGWRFAEGMKGVQCDEDRLAFADGAFDLVVSVGVLDSVNDLPGALALIRRVLRPDGLFLAAFAGAGSLPRLRSAMLAADALKGEASPRIHPQIDVRAAGDLLTRAGFALQVADSDSVDVRFTSFFQLVADLRAMGGTNVLSSRSRSMMSKAQIGAAAADFAGHAESDGKTTERFEIVYLTGWAPAPSQPQPARRGSAAASLASVLRPSG